MGGFGVPVAYGDLRRVLMHRPGPELDMVTEETAADFHFRRPVDRERFVADWDRMHAAFDAHGVETLLLTDVLAEDRDALNYIARRPNITYVRDLAAVFARGAVMMRPSLKGRWWDEWVVRRAFERLGVPIIGSIEAPGRLEGGGVTLIGDDVAVASICDRGNEEGTAALREIVLGRDVRSFLEVPLPGGHVHIDGLFMVLDERLCLLDREALSVYPCRLFEAGRSEPRWVLFEEFLSDRGMTRIPITRQERDEAHLNVVVTKRSERAVGFAEARRIGEEMGERGFHLDGFPGLELIQGNGGAHCMTCPVLVT